MRMRFDRPWQMSAQSAFQLGAVLLCLAFTPATLAADASTSPDQPSARSQAVSKGSTKSRLREARQWWSYAPLKEVTPPDESLPGWGRNPIDRFVGRSLAEAGLQPQRDADRIALLRRAVFDLWGLPPTPEQIDAFLADSRPDAYERWVDDLLASPHYGERWARHWLDQVRYADSDGYRVDDFRPNAWRYRDYVIRALNADKPYDRFIQEQLAGDELWPDDSDALVATGYLRLGIYEYNNRDAVGQWATLLNDITDTTGEVMLGMSLQCARCHDHKFDPLLQKDYYRLQAFFAGLHPEGDAPVVPSAQRADYQRALEEWNQKTHEIQTAIQAIEAPYRKLAEDEVRSKFPPETQALLSKPVSERTPSEHQIAELAYRQFTYAYERLSSRVKPADKEALAGLRRQLSEFDALKPAPLPHATIATEVGPIPAPTFIPRKGNEEIQPGFPTLFGEAPAQIVRPVTAQGSSGRRATLARWLTDPKNPVAGRVIVNRVWQYHFGRGLAANSSDFGRMGETPSHPDLLDWLSAQFIRDGWSLKALHRRIMTSATYRQSSRISKEGELVLGDRPGPVPNSLGTGGLTEGGKMGQRLDPENRLLWRGNVRRLDAEQARDAMLAASGELDLTMAGPAVDSTRLQRSVYLKVLRNTRDAFLDAFDAPQNFASSCQRDITTTPIQSLLLINSSWMVQRAQSMARKIIAEQPNAPESWVRLAYRRAFSREPSASELRTAARFLQEQEARVDLPLALSANAGFRSDKIPFRDGKAAAFAGANTEEPLTAPMVQTPPASAEFTVEAYVYLKTGADEMGFRTIAARWDADAAEPAWLLGVTGKRYERKPISLFFQMGSTAGSTNPIANRIHSDIPVRLDRPYFVSASVRAVPGQPIEVTFHIKDLSNDDEPVIVAHATGLDAVEPGRFERLTIGGRMGGGSPWDGMIDDVRLSRGALGRDQLLLAGHEPVADSTLGLWRFEVSPGYFRDVSKWGNDLLPNRKKSGLPMTAQTLALADLCHVLLNSNEFLYVE